MCTKLFLDLLLRKKKCCMHYGYLSSLIALVLPPWPFFIKASTTFCKCLLFTLFQTWMSFLILAKIWRVFFLFLQCIVWRFCLCHCIPSTPISHLLWQIQYLWLTFVLHHWSNFEIVVWWRTFGASKSNQFWQDIQLRLSWRVWRGSLQNVCHVDFFGGTFPNQYNYTLPFQGGKSQIEIWFFEML